MKKRLRHNEYYDMQQTFDNLYSYSKNNNNFYHLMEIILQEDNIKLAFRNIKKNHGSQTAGTDGKTIKDIEKLSVEEFTKIIRNKLKWYKPKPVRRVEIPKPNGKTRPLGIPTIVDRIVQQCILQVLEPICEAHFHERNNGFRPNRSTEHAISQCYRMIQQYNLYYVVDIDIKSFFDNVNHSKLIKQMWTLGIRDKQLLCIIKEMLKAPIILSNNETLYPQKGTPQGGILSPLLSNIVLNELDWWITSQWEEIKTRKEYKDKISKNGNKQHGSRNKALKRTSRLKEVYIVRYADDFKLFCRNRADAEKIFIATKNWLKERLKLDISEEKSKIVNLKSAYSEFLGFKIKATPRRNKYVVVSHMSDKAIERETKKLKEQLKKIAKPHDENNRGLAINLYNSMVWGIHNYYRYATKIYDDCDEIQYNISTILESKHGLGNNLKKTGILTPYIKKKYGKSKRLRYINGKPICPIGYVEPYIPIYKKFSICNYTKEGRNEIHKKLGFNTSIMLQMMKQKLPNKSIEYMDNRISLYAGQKGKCAVTGIDLDINDIHCHHKIPIKNGGTDKYENLIIVHKYIHKLIHATTQETINKYLSMIKVNEKAMIKLNKLRKIANNNAIALN